MGINKISALDDFKQFIADAVKEAAESGTEEGLMKSDIMGTAVDAITKQTRGKKIVAPIEVELQPKIKDINLGKEQAKQFNSLKNKKVVQYYTDEETAIKNLNAAYALYEKHLSQGKKPNSSAVKNDIGNIVRLGNAYVAIGGNVDKLDTKIKQLYKDASSRKGFNPANGYQYGVGDMKKAFDLMRDMLNNGFDMSAFKSKFVNAAVDAASDASKAVSKTIEKEAKKGKTKTATSKVDNTEKINALKEELEQEEARYDELEKKKAEITKRRNEKQNEVIDDILNQQEKNLTNQLKKRDNERSKAFKARMDEEDFYYTDKKGNKKKITSFKTGNKTADRVYYERKANNASLDYWQTLVMNTPVEDKARSKQLAEQYKLKETRKIQQNEKEYYDNVRKQIQYRTGNISNSKWGQEITKFFSSEIGENLDAMTHAINFDDLKVYKGYTEKQATQFYEFIHLLEQFCINAGSSFKGFEDTVDSIDIKSLFYKFLDAFKGFPEITKQYDLKGFTDFVNQMSGMVKESGLKKDGTFNEKKFQKFTDKYGTDDIKTRFLKSLGYQGYDLSRTSYGKLLDGTVLFDEARKNNIISSSDMIDELDKNVESFVSERVHEIMQAAVIEIIKKYQNYKAPVYYNQEQIDNIKEAQRTKKKAIDVNSRKADQNLEQFIDKSYNVTGDELTASKNMLTIIGKLKYIFEKQNKEMPADVQSLFEELIGQFVDFSKDKSAKTDKSQMWKSDIKTKLKELYDSRESLTADQINEAFGLQNTKGDIKLQERIFNTLLGEKTTMEDLASLSEIIYSNEKKRSQITEDNSKKKNESKELVDQGYNAEKSAIDSKISKKIDAPFKKEFKDVDKDLEATRKNIVEKRKQLLLAEFEQLSSSIESEMTQEEVDAIHDKGAELRAKAIEYGLDTGRGNIHKQIEDFENNLDDQVKIVEKKADQLEEAVADYNQVKDKMAEAESEDITTPSTKGVDEEASAMRNVKEESSEAAEAKSKFAEANAEVLQSIVASLTGLTDEGELFKNLNAIIDKLSDNDGIENLTKNITALKDVLSSSIDDNSFLGSLKDLASNGATLKDLADVLNTSQKKLDAAKKAVKDVNADKGIVDDDTNKSNQIYDLVVDKKRDIIDVNRLVAASEEILKAGAEAESESVRELINEIVILVMYLKMLEQGDANTQLPVVVETLGRLYEVAEKAGIKLPDISEGMRSIGDASADVVFNMDKATAAIEKQSDELDNAADAFSRYVTSTRIDIGMDADGHIVEHSRSYRTQDRAGTKSQYTRTPEYDDNGNPTGRYTQTANQQVDYTAIVKQASKALIDQAEIEHKIDIEHQKSNGDLRILGELYVQLADATRRYSEALEVARDIHRDYMEYINDTSEGTKYQLDSYFHSRVAEQTNVPISQIDEKYRKRVVDRTNTYKQKIGSAIDTIQFEIDNGKHTSSFIQELNNLLTRLAGFDSIDIFDEQNIEDVNNALNEFKNLSKSGKLAANKQANENSVSKGLTQINSILSGNTKSAFRNTDVYKQLVLLQSAFKNFDTSRPQSELNALNSRLLSVKADFEELSEVVKGKNFFQTFLERLRGANAQLIAQYLSFQDIIRYIRSLATTLIDLDTQLIDLRKTTTMNTAELNEFYHASSSVAKQLGVTTSEIISQAAQWSRLGYNTKEASTEMAKLSSQFASISPGMSTEEAQTGLVSIMKAWDVDVENVSRNIMDNINTLGNKFAETNQDIVEGMERAGATLSAIGTDVEDAFALFTGAQEVIQNAETVGTALKTLSLRIRGYDEETEELSNDVIKAMGDVANLTKVASNNFAGISLWADADQTKYRSLKDYLGDISKIWSEISEGNRTQLLEKLFGKRGASVGSAILGNFDQVEKALEEMENAAGSSDREMGIIRDSMEFKLNAIKQEWIETLTTITDSGDLKSLLDFILKVSEGLGNIVSNLGLIKTLVVGVSAVVGSQKLG